MIREHSIIKYKGFSYKPIVKLSDAKINAEGDFYEYSIQGWVKNRSRLVKGAGVFENPEGAARAANSFAKQEIDKHLTKFESSLINRIYCALGYCPASKFS